MASSFLRRVSLQQADYVQWAGYPAHFPGVTYAELGLDT